MAYYTIKSRLGNNLYLSVDAGRTSVSLKTGVASANQQWRCSGLQDNVEIYSGSLGIYAINAKTNTWICDVTKSNPDTFVNFIPYGKYYMIQLASDTNRYLTAGGSSNGAKVSWTKTSSGDSVCWDVQETELIVPPRSHTIQMPSGRNCNWNQYYSPIVSALKSEKGCTIVTALDLMNFYGPKSYTIDDAVVGWDPNKGITWGTAWPGNFRVGAKFEGLAKPEFLALIRSEISQGRPVIVNVGTDNSHSHTVMCYGYTNLNSDYSDFLVMDPAGTGSSGANNPNGQMRTLWQAMDYSHRTDGIWSMFFTYSKA